MGFLDNVKSMAQNTMEKGKEMAEITKWNVAITNFEDEIKKSKWKIGDIIYEKGQPLEDLDIEIQELIIRIDKCRESIEETREKINRLKNLSICAECGAEVKRGEKFCGKCGKPMPKLEDLVSAVQMEMRKCPSCGMELTENVSFCTNCGNMADTTTG